MFGALGRIWLILVGFLLTPLILSYLGNERFALWAIFWSITAYIMLMDMGMGVSLVRQVAQSLEKQAYTHINQAVVSVLLMMIVVAGSVWLMIWGLSLWLLPIAGVSSVVQQDIVHLVTWGPLVFLLIATFRVFDAVLRGLQRFDLILQVTLTTSVVNVLGIYLTLSWGFGVLGLMWATVASYTFQLFALYVLTKKTLPQLS
ncbi:MAG: MATE family efflux transporter, partial [Ghiorsea sp.]|nr:MATE family efflux transporter [Ghiorsea sp.]